MKKYQYKTIVVQPPIESIDQALNMLGADGWIVVGVLSGALHDDVNHARVVLMRETGDRDV